MIKADERKIIRFTMIMCLLLVVLLIPLTARGSDKTGMVRVRVKDLATIQGNNNNQLVGYGLVTGLRGTGDKTKVLSNIMINNMFDNLGMKLDPKELNRLQAKNSAVCMVTAQLPASFRSGDSIDVTVSSAGDATSLQGGILVFATLMGPDGKVYASAQGPVSVGAGEGSRDKTLVGRIPNGGIIARNMDADLVRGGNMTWVLNNPDFETATRIAKAINTAFRRDIASPMGDRFVVVDADGAGLDPSNLAARIGEMGVLPDARARVVVNERTVTVVMGGNVKILPVAISHGNLTLKVETPRPATAGEDQNQNLMGGVETFRRDNIVMMGGNATVRDVIDVLNQIGAKPADLITILQALKNAGALQGELEII